MNKVIRLADFFGITASALFLVHCLGTPFVFALVPILGVSFPDNSIHRVMALAVIVPVLLALVPGFMKHRRHSVLAFGTLGLICFITAVFVIGPRYGEV